MRSHPGFRRAAKWAGLAATFLLVALWAWSTERDIIYDAGPRLIEISCGTTRLWWFCATQHDERAWLQLHGAWEASGWEIRRPAMIRRWHQELLPRSEERMMYG